MVLQPVLHLHRLISIMASGAGGSSVKMGIKTSPDFPSKGGWMTVLLKLQMRRFPYQTYHLHMRWLRGTLNFRLPSLVVNCHNPVVLCTYSIFYPLGCSSYRTRAVRSARSSVTHKSANVANISSLVSRKAYQQVALVFPLNVLVWSEPLRTWTPKNSLLFSGSWTSYAALMLILWPPDSNKTITGNRG